MKATLRNRIFAVVLVLGLAVAPVASAQSPHLAPGVSPDQSTSWLDTMLSWWNGFWNAAATSDSLSESSTTTSPDDDTSPDTSSEGTESVPTGDGDNGPGLDPLGGS